MGGRDGGAGSVGAPGTPSVFSAHCSPSLLNGGPCDMRGKIHIVGPSALMGDGFNSSQPGSCPPREFDS